MTGVAPARHEPVPNIVGQCIECGLEVVECFRPFRRTGLEQTYLRHKPIPRLRAIPDRERTHCSKCGKPGQWYEFKPGSGECTECQT